MPQRWPWPSTIWDGSYTKYTAHGSLKHSARPGIQPATSWTFLGSITAEPQEAISFDDFHFWNFENGYMNVWFSCKKKMQTKGGQCLKMTFLPPAKSYSRCEKRHPEETGHCLTIKFGPLPDPALGIHQPLALHNGSAPVRSLIRTHRNQRAGPSKTWWALH